MRDKATCPCCGYKTLENGDLNEYDICPICRWENYYTQRDDPDYAGGANDPSLRQAQQNFLRIGTSDPLHKGRKPGPTDIKDPQWKPF